MCAGCVIMGSYVTGSETTSRFGTVESGGATGRWAIFFRRTIVERIERDMLDTCHFAAVAAAAAAAAAAD